MIEAGQGARAPGAALINRLERELHDVVTPSVETTRKGTARLEKSDPPSLIVFVDRVSATSPFVCRVQVVESRGGDILLSGLFAEEDGIVEPKPLVDLIRRGVAKHGVPLKDRRYLAIVGVRNEDPSDALDDLARTLATLLPVSLQHCPSIVLVDREHVQRLADAPKAGRPAKPIAPSWFLLDGGLRRKNGGTDAVLTLLLTSQGGGPTQKLEFELRPDRVDTFGEDLVAALAPALAAAAPAASPDPEPEGRQFVEQARLLTISGDKEGALAAAEAAYAIWPARESRINLAFASSNLMLDGLHSDSLTKGQRYSRDDRPYFKADATARAKSLAHEARVLELILQQSRLDLAVEVRGNRSSPDRHALTIAIDTYSSLGKLTRPTPAGSEELHRRVESMRRELFDMVIGRSMGQPARLGHQYWEILQVALNNLRLWSVSDDDLAIVRAQAEGLAELFELCHFGGGRDNFRYASFNERFQGALGNLDRLRGPAHDEAREVFAVALQKRADDADVAVRVLAWHGLTSLDVDGTKAATHVLELLAAGGLERGFIPQARAEMAVKALSLLEAKREIETALTLCERLADHVFSDSALNTGWRAWIEKWCALAKSGPGGDTSEAIRERALEYFRKALADRPLQGNAVVEQERRCLEDVIRMMGGTKSEPPEQTEEPPWSAAWPDDPWRHYDIKPLELGLRGEVTSIFVHGDRLYAMQIHDGRPGPRRLAVTVHRFPDGGPAIRQASIAFQDGARTGLFPALMDGTLYIGMSAGIAAFDSKDELTMLTEADGLPGRGVGALAAWGDNLYVGMTDGKRTAFVEYSPSTKKSRMIFSNVAVDPGRRRDFDVSFILPDKPRDCLWVMGDRPALWRYAPSTDTFEAVANGQGVGRLLSAHDHPVPMNGGLLASSSGETRFLELPSGRSTLLLGGHARQTKPAFGFWPNPNGGHPMPMWYDGDSLLSFSSKNKPAFYLYQGATEPAAHPAPKAMRHWRPVMTVSEAGPVIMSPNGDGFLIQRRSDAPKRDPVSLAVVDPATRSVELMAEAAAISPWNAEIALVKWQEVVDRSPDPRQAETALYNLAVTATSAGKHQRAIDAFEQFLERFPKSAWETRIRDNLLPAARRLLNESKP